MITEDYVSFKTAKLLKEKGFNEPCIWLYSKKGEKHYASYYHSPWPNNDLAADEWACCTQAMAMKWLREVWKCYITFTWEFKKYDKNYKPIYKDITWSFNIAIPKYNSARKGDGDYFDLDSDKEYDSYETACEASIKYCLEHLI